MSWQTTCLFFLLQLEHNYFLHLFRTLSLTFFPSCLNILKRIKAYNLNWSCYTVWLRSLKKASTSKHEVLFTRNTFLSLSSRGLCLLMFNYWVRTADAGDAVRGWVNRHHLPALLTLELVDGAQDVTESAARLEIQETLGLRTGEEDGDVAVMHT